MPKGTRVVLLGNEAIARGIIESSIKVVSGYPGTPSSEVIMALAPLARDLGIYVEWAVNEKVGFEIALGAAFAGIRSFASMKAPGINVALDSIVSAAYSSVNAGCIIYVADDPGPHTTQTEQDSRWIADFAKLPMIEPSSPQEAKDFVKLGIKLSESSQLPIILRCTTRVSHTSGDVVYGEIETVDQRPSFKKDIARFVRASMVGNRERHRWLIQQLEVVERISDELGINKVYGDGSTVIITAGITFSYVYELLKNHNLLNKVKLIKMGLIYPLPRKFLLRELTSAEKVLIVEELDPYIELKIRSFVQKEGLEVKVFGKNMGIPEIGELNPYTIANALSEFLNVSIKLEENTSKLNITTPPRPPPLCPGCPHRYSYIAILEGIKKAGFQYDQIPIMGDIGCYALSYEPPLEAIWTEHSMGASIGLALGIKAAGYPYPIIATIGDSTFFHAGIPPLIEAIHKDMDILIVILDNRVVAMTGHQSTPAWSTTESGRMTKPIDIEDILKGLNVMYEIVDPRDLDKAIETVSQFLKIPTKGPRVIVFRAPCALLEIRRRKLLGPIPKLDISKCKNCMLCIIKTGCPALTYDVIEDKKYPRIIESMCVGCGLCVKICPFNAYIWS